ncbi:peptidoglycan-binding protein [bacterium]|nr:peptidoglycan-binding protein [bacterium]
MKAIKTLTIIGLVFGLAACAKTSKTTTTDTAEMTSLDTPTTTKVTKFGGPADVAAIQEALNTTTGTNLVVDGIMGKKTVEALKAFQKKTGLKTTGKADVATIEKLGLNG